MFLTAYESENAKQTLNHIMVFITYYYDGCKYFVCV